MADETPVDLSEFYKYSRPRRPPCRVGVAIAQLKKPADRATVEAALAANKDIITGSAIVTWFEKRGIDTLTAPSTVTNHRKKSCTCFD